MKNSSHGAMRIVTSKFSMTFCLNNIIWERKKGENSELY